MQVAFPPVTFLFSALHYILYNGSADVSFEIDHGHEVEVARLPLIPSRYILADTKLGRVKGIKQQNRNKETYFLFRGIPYAKPPVGDLRYEAPQPHEGWKGELSTTYFRPQCLQVNVFTRTVVGREDCLFLNVATKKAFTKETIPYSNKGLKPVIVYFHGGLFMFGGSNIFRPKYFMDEDIVLVTLNYRLNSFGFLNTGDGVVSGNMGLKDQAQALKWIQENIKYFGGDPKRVYIMGESAGGVSSHLHTLSPMSHGLFAGAISLSGTALSPWGHILEPEVQAKEFGQGNGCPTHNTKMMVKCLKQMPAHKVARFHLGYLNKRTEGQNAFFGPTVDSGKGRRKFLYKKPLELLQSGRISKKPWITGVNSGDGLVYLIPILRNDTLRKLISSKWDHFAPRLLSYESSPKRFSLTDELSSYYLHDQVGISHEHINDTGHMFSDRGFFLDNHDVAVMQSQRAPTYAYYYTYEGVFSLSNLLFYKSPIPIPNDWNYMVGGGMVWLSNMMLNKKRKRKTDIVHGDELPLLFNIPLIRREVTKNDKDYEFSRRLVKLFVSFAETGIPDASMSGGNTKWNRIPRSVNWDEPLQRLNIDERFKMIDEPFYERMKFWKRHEVEYLPFNRKNSSRTRRPRLKPNFIF